MHEFQKGGKNLSGDYYYTKHNKPIEIKGVLNPENNTFEIDEFSKGEKTGTFVGTIHNDLSISGEWKGGNKSMPFSLTKTKKLFAFYSKDLPFHPIQVNELSSFDGTKKTVDISLPVKLPENYTMYENSQNGFTIDYGDDFAMRTPYFEYSYFGHQNNLYVVEERECGGGTGIFSSIDILELDGNILKEVKTIAAGDRCNGEVFISGFNQGIITFSQSITPMDLYSFADSTLNKPSLALESCAICCVGEAVFEYDLEKNDLQFLYFSPDELIEETSAPINEWDDMDYLYSLLEQYGKKYNYQLNEDQINDLTIDLVKAITE